jgi:hypothetical protein
VVSKTYRPQRDQIVIRAVALMVEHRSPKPGVGGSSPSSPANYMRDL